MNAPNKNESLSKPSTATLPVQAISLDVLIEKYAKNGETSVEQVQMRVAKALAEKEADPKHMEKLFYDTQVAGFIPAGRINSAAGMNLRATLINCFVQPVGDSVSEVSSGKVGIYKALAEAAETMRRGGGVGYDFSSIRPKDAVVKGTQSRASGPVSFMRVFNSSCSTVESAGARRGAQMGMLRCDHPDIEEFVSAKSQGDLTNFNISISVTDEFMLAVSNNTRFELIHQAEPSNSLKEQGAYQLPNGKWVYRSINARDLWETVMRNTYNFAEPGIIFISRINKENNLHYCETIEAVNPCAEQPLPDYGCCCLGSINLTKFVRNAFSDDADFDYVGFSAVVNNGIRMLDNVLDVTAWPLVEQQQEAMNKRRIGLGFLGLGSALVLLGIRYDSDEGRLFAETVSETMRNSAYEASVELAKEKGAFPLFDAEKYLNGAFAKRLPESIRQNIREHGIRNSHLLSIAPTGTITLAFADNASNGIEPAFSWVYNRKKRMVDDTHMNYEVADHAWRLYRHLGKDVSDDSKLPPGFVTALQMSATNHMKMLEVVQPYIDSAISKTVNVPEDYPYEDFQTLYFDAWKAGLKGLATYRPNNVLGSVLSVAPATTETSTASAIKPAVQDVDPLRVQFDSRPLGDLDSVTSKVQYITYEGKKTVYLTVSFNKVTGIIDGEEITVERPFEFFMPAGQKNDGQQWISFSMRLLSMAARSGGSIAKALEDMREVVWDKGTVRCGSITKDDGTQAPLFHESEVAAIGYALQRILIKRNFLDAAGNQIPLKALGKKLKTGTDEFLIEEDKQTQYLPVGLGKKCPECGAYQLQKIDGCQRCLSCNYVGSCG